MSTDIETLTYLVEEITALREEVKGLNERVEEQEEELERVADLKREEIAGLKEADHYLKRQHQLQHSQKEQAQQQQQDGTKYQQVPQTLPTQAVLSHSTTGPSAIVAYNALTEDKFELPRDVFTMYFFARCGSQAFFYALGVYAIQLISLSIIVYDLLDDDLREGDDDGNPFNVPIQVEVQVQVARCLAILISVISRDDVLDTFRIVTVGYKSRWKSIFEGATKPQFMMMNLMRLSEGLFVIFISFIFIVQSDNVLDLFLNFAAIEFISLLDNQAYELAQQGWLSQSMQSLTELISETHVFLTLQDKEKLRRKHFWKHFLIVFLLAGLYTGNFLILRAERKGLILKSTACSHVRFGFGEQQFDYGAEAPGFTGFQYDTQNLTVWGGSPLELRTLRESTRPVFRSFEGVNAPILIYSDFSNDYIARPETTIFGRHVYDETGYNDITSGMFYYCEKEKSWVFTIRALAMYNAVPQETINRCGKHGWLLRSPVTDAFSLDEVPEEGWTVWTGTLVDATDIEIYCSNCNSDIDCGIQRGTCNSNEICDCEEDFTGTFCEREQGCDIVAKYVQGKATILTSTNLYAYDRPTYRRMNEKKDEPTPDALSQEYEFLIYTGRRWSVVRLSGQDLAIFTKGMESMSDPAFSDRFAQQFHAYWFDLHGGKQKLISEVTAAEVPTGDLQWFGFGESRARGDYGFYGYFIPHVVGFECLSVDCNIRTLCGNQGVCESVSNIKLFGGKVETQIEGNQCVCNEGSHFTGHYCEYANSVEFDANGRVTEGPFQMDPYLTPCYIPPYKDVPDCLGKLYPDYVARPNNGANGPGLNEEDGSDVEGGTPSNNGANGSGLNEEDGSDVEGGNPPSP